MNVNVRIGKSEEVVDLRHRILRQGLPREAAMFEGDDEPTTYHFLAELDGKLVGCATILRRPWNDQPAWQLRGMAVDDARQRCGVGAKLVEALERFVRDHDQPPLLWCNARAPAIGFYERCGWQVASEQFVIETAGPHRRMTRTL